MGGRRLAGLLRACHPEPAFAVTAVSGALAVATGRGLGTVWVTTAVLAGQLSVGWSNDVIDRNRDRAAGRPDKPVAAGELPARLVGIAAAVALAAAVPLSFASGWRASLAHLLGVAAAWAYNLGVKATPLSPLPYAVAFGALPAFVLLGLPHHPWPPLWMTAAGVLLGVGAHFANVVPDIRADIRLGVVGLAHRIGVRASLLLAGVLLLAANVVLTVGPDSAPDLVGGAGLGVTTTLLIWGLLAARRPGSRVAFRVALAVAAVDVALLVVRGSSLTPR